MKMAISTTMMGLVPRFSTVTTLLMAKTGVILTTKGVMARGLVKIGDGQQYFDQNGYQVKGKVVRAKDGKLRYFDKDSGNAVINRFAQGDNP